MYVRAATGMAVPFSWITSGEKAGVGSTLTATRATWAGDCIRGRAFQDVGGERPHPPAPKRDAVEHDPYQGDYWSAPGIQCRVRIGACISGGGIG